MNFHTLRGDRFNIGGTLFFGLARDAQLLAFHDRLGNLRREQTNRAQRVIVAGNDVIHFAGIAVRIHDRNHGNA